MTFEERFFFFWLMFSWGDVLDRKNEKWSHLIFSLKQRSAPLCSWLYLSAEVSAGDKLGRSAWGPPVCCLTSKGAMVSEGLHWCLLWDHGLTSWSSSWSFKSVTKDYKHCNFQVIQSVKKERLGTKYASNPPQLFLCSYFDHRELHVMGFFTSDHW